jgi:hypothetical protein
MQAITLDVIMSGIFGIDGAPARGAPSIGPAHARSSSSPPLSTSRVVAKLGELVNVGT